MAKKVKKIKKATQPEQVKYEFSSGNVFEDFGLPSPGEMDIKHSFAMLIRSIIKQKKMTQKKAAQLMDIDQPKVSKIIRGVLSEFTIERLMNYLVALGCDVEIRLTLNRVKVPSIHVA